MSVACIFVTIISIISIISNMYLFRVVLGKVREVEIGGIFLLALKIVTTKIATINVTITANAMTQIIQ